MTENFPNPPSEPVAPAEPSSLTDDAMRRLALEAAFLRLAAGGGWSQVTLAAVAEAADLPLSTLYRLFPSRALLLPGLMAEIDRIVLESLEADPVDKENERDRLFDLLMRRFDALAPYRLSLQAIIPELPWSPLGLAAAGMGLGRAMSWMLTGAGLLTTGPLGLAQIAGLSLAWLTAFRVWLRDDSPDLGPTMAALDHALHRAEQAGRFVGMGS